MQIHLSLCLFLHESIFQCINLLICHISIFYLHFFPSIFYSSNIYTYFIYNLIHFVIHSSINPLIYLSIYFYNFIHPSFTNFTLFSPHHSPLCHQAAWLVVLPEKASFHSRLDNVLLQRAGQPSSGCGLELLPLVQLQLQLWWNVYHTLFVFVCVCSVFLENKIAFSWTFGQEFIWRTDFTGLSCLPNQSCA